MFNYEKYDPEKELPEEITNLPKEQTKCKFCGVSYLVHHEVKKLENQLLKIQSELDEFHTEREKLKEVPILHTQIKELNLKLNKQEERLREERELYHKKATAQETVKLHVLSLLRSATQSLQNYREEIKDLKQCMESLVTCNMGNIGEAVKYVSKLHKQWRQILKVENQSKQKLQQQMDSERARAKVATERLINEIQDEKDKVTEQAKELHAMKEIIKSMEETISKMKSRMEELQYEKFDLQQKLKTEVDGWVNKVQIVSNKHTEQMTSLKREIFERNDEVILLKSKLKKESEEYESRLANLKRENKKMSDKFKAKDDELQKFQKLSAHQTAEKVALIKQQLNQGIVELRKEKASIHKEHSQLIDQLRNDHQKQIEELKVKLGQSERALQDTIKSLQQQLAHEQKIFEVDSMRHIRDVKDFTYKLQLSAKAVEEKNEQLDHVHRKMQLIDEENKSIKKDCQELSQGKNDLDKKLQEAYNEISCLQKTVEQQCVERTELMVKLNTCLK